MIRPIDFSLQDVLGQLVFTLHTVIADEKQAQRNKECLAWELMSWVCWYRNFTVDKLKTEFTI